MTRWSTAFRLGQVGLAYFLLCLVGSQTPAQKLLRWRLRPGETIQVQLSQKMDTAAQIQGAELKSTVDMAMVMKWQVMGVDANGTAEMTQSIERMKMTMQSPGYDTVTYDSATKTKAEGPAQSIAAGIEPLLGVKFIQKMNNRGEIVDLRLSKEAAEALDRVPSGAQVKEMFSKDGLKSLVSQAAAVLPDKPVRPGDTWRGHSVTKSPAGDLEMDMQYTYYGSEQRQGKKLDKIGVDLVLSFADGANPLGLSVQVKDQDNQGVLYFDAAEGRFVETWLHQKLALETALGNQTHVQNLDMQLVMRFVSDRTARQSSPPRRTATAPRRVAPKTRAGTRR